MRTQVATYLEQIEQIAAAGRPDHVAYPEPPYALILGERLKEWASLPYGGGLLDQPETLMQQIEAALSERDRWRSERQRALTRPGDPTKSEDFVGVPRPETGESHGERPAFELGAQ